MLHILVINGPNLNFLGIRERAVYGAKSYGDLCAMLAELGEKKNIKISVYQSNYEGAIIDRLQSAYYENVSAIIINPGAYTHYSYAIRDALAAFKQPKVEVHISDIFNREDFRKVSVIAPVCDLQIKGKGLDGYIEAIDWVLNERGTV